MKRTLTSFQQAYLDCALWSSTDNSDDSGGEPLDKNYSIHDIDLESLDKMIADCQRFCTDNELLLSQAGEDSQNGHDFWLTRNGHGAGFWDRGYPKDIGDRLTEACKAFGVADLYVDEGKVHCA